MPNVGSAEAVRLNQLLCQTEEGLDNALEVLGRNTLGTKGLYSEFARTDSIKFGCWVNNHDIWRGTVISTDPNTSRKYVLLRLQTDDEYWVPIESLTGSDD